MKIKFLSLVSLFLPMLLLLISVLHLGKDIREKIQLNNMKEIAATESKDGRVEVLERFFEKYNSPLKDSAAVFVKTAEKYNIDYKILPAISCMESTCGKYVIPNTYNPFGWGIYGKKYIAFSSFDEAIEKVGEGLNKGYFSKGLNTISKMAPVYTPPNSYHWTSGVTYFMYKMEEIEKEQIREDLKEMVLTYL